MRIQLVERIVIRDYDPKSKTFLRVKNSCRREIEHYYSKAIPRVGDVIAVKKSKDASPIYYDVICVIHFYSIYNKHEADDYNVEIEVKKHIGKHPYSENGHTFTEDWPLISELGDK